MRFVIVQRMIVVGLTPGMKFLARIFRNEPVDFERIAEEISENSTMSSGDVMGVLRQLEKVIMLHILDGTTVKLGALGTFSAIINATACATKEEVKASTIKRVWINFRPSVAFSKRLKDTKTHIVDLDIKGLQNNE
ncbi:MAG: HU family DNA-binding protein [Bacteroidales bacterium]|nr:HU family DNA-binding protein [Bacteroidales bacterium]